MEILEKKKLKPDWIRRGGLEGMGGKEVGKRKKVCGTENGEERQRR